MRNHTKILSIVMTITIIIGTLFTGRFSAASVGMDAAVKSGYDMSTQDQSGPMELHLNTTYRVSINSNSQYFIFIPDHDMIAQFEASSVYDSDATDDSVGRRTIWCALYTIEHDDHSYEEFFVPELANDDRSGSSNGGNYWTDKRCAFYELTAGKTYYYEVVSYDVTVDVTVSEPEHFSAVTGTKYTITEGYSIYEYTPEKDMLVYFHSIGASGVFGYMPETSCDGFDRSQTVAVKGGKTIYIILKALKEATGSYGKVTYDGFDFAIEEIPVVSMGLGETKDFDFRSPYKFEAKIPDPDIKWPEVGHSVISAMPIQAVSFTANEDCWVDFDYDNGRIYAQDLYLYNSDMTMKKEGNPYGVRYASFKAGETCYLLVETQESCINDIVPQKYTLTVEKREMRNLTEGHNIITQKSGSNDEMYVFNVPKNGYWMISCPGAISYFNIVLAYNSENYGTDFALDYPMICVGGVIYVTVKSNYFDEDMTYDIEIINYHYPEIKPNETKSVSLEGYGDKAVFEFTPDRPMLLSVESDIKSEENCRFSVGAVHNNRSLSGDVFAVFPGETYYLSCRINAKEEDEYCSAHADITLKDISNSIEELVPGVATADEAAPDSTLIYRYTGTEDMLIQIESTYKSEVTVYEQGKKDSLNASGDYYFCEADTAYFICLQNNDYYSDEGEILLTEKLVQTGDADGDGQVTLMDATQIQHSLAIKGSEDQDSRMKYGDVDRNGLLEILDSTFIQRWTAGIEIPYEIG